MVEKQGNVIQTISSYAVSLEQRLLHFTFACIGASVGFFQGSFKATQRLQPHFTSTNGFKELLYGSEHRQEREHLSITDLVKSWIPSFSSGKPKQIDGPREATVNYSKTNGFAKGSATDVQTDPTQTPEKPVTAKARDFTPKKMYEHLSGAEPAKGGVPHAEDGSLALPMHTHSFDSEPPSEADTAETEDDDHTANGDDPNHHRKRKKAARALKKAGQKIKKVFEPIVQASSKENGGMIGSCTAHPPATK